MQPAALLYKRRKAREDFTSFAGLIATPGNLATGVALPAGAALYASRSVATLATTKILDVKAAGGTLVAEQHLGTVAADAPYWVGHAREDLVLVKAVGLAGTLRVYVRNGIGTLFKIAEG